MTESAERGNRITAKMQWNLFLLILMGSCSILTCHLYEYHFINKEMTWDEAQSYCRETHTDLAVVDNMSDMKRLQHSAKRPGRAWIGLRNRGGKKMWLWSLPGVEYKESEDTRPINGPHGQGGAEDCVWMDRDKKYHTSACSEEKAFICYNENSRQKFHVIEQRKPWIEAQRFCRENHKDLLIRDQRDSFCPFQTCGENHKNLNSKDQRNTQSITQMWIGLFRDTWEWADGSNFSFRQWENLPTDECAFLKSSGKWGSSACTEHKPFLCYDDKLRLIQENLTWVEALYYCREHHRDLVSITSTEQQTWVGQRVKKASTPFVWLGIRYTCTLNFWFWIGNQRLEYLNWGSDGSGDECSVSGAIERGGQHKWFKKSEENRFNFICSEF